MVQWPFDSDQVEFVNALIPANTKELLTNPNDDEEVS